VLYFISSTKENIWSCVSKVRLYIYVVFGLRTLASYTHAIISIKDKTQTEHNILNDKLTSLYYHYMYLI